MLKPQLRALWPLALIPLVAAVTILAFRPLKSLLSRPRPLTLTRADRTSPYLFAAAGRDLEIQIGTKETNEPSVAVKANESSLVSFHLTDTKPSSRKPLKEGNKLTFTDVRPDTDLIYTTLPNGLKEEIIVKKPQKGNAFTFRLDLEGAAPKAMTTGFYSPVFYDDAGNYLYHLEKPFAVDASGVRTDDVLLQIQAGDEAKLYARIIVDQGWLDRATYPVTVDPTIIHDETSEFATGQLNRVKDMTSTTTAFATGGTITYSGGYTIHTFTSNGTFTPTIDLTVDYLVVGGGGGGSGGGNFGGGGGAGQYRSGSLGVTTQAYSITVGGGGGPNTAGANSIFSSITSVGGNGGSGITGGTSGNSYAGGNGSNSSPVGGGGGGGSSAIGNDRTGGSVGGSGGAGTSSSISGSSVSYAGGGGGAGETGGAGTSGGGTGGSNPAHINGYDATANTGSGGGGAVNATAGSGGSGIVIIRYLSPPQLETDYQELAADQYTVGLWHMNESADNSCSGGQDACDVSGNGNHGTATGTTINTTSQKLGTASRTFNGSTEFLDMGSPSSLINITQAITVEAWIKRGATATLGHIAGTYGASDLGYNLTFGVGDANNDKICFTIQSVANYCTSGTYPDTTQWHHVAATYDRSKINLYFDGNLVNTFSQTVALTVSNGTFRIGKRAGSGTYAFNGSIDEVRISNIARTPEEIKLSAQRRPYSVYTSDVIDMTTVSGWNPLTWTELGVTTGDGETLKDSTDLVSQWNFNNTTSTTTATSDAGSCGVTCNGTLTNMTTTGQDAAAGTGWTSANRRWGAGAVMFDGSNDYVDMGDVAAANLSVLSVETWLKANTLANSSIVDKMPWAAGSNGWRINTRSNGDIWLQYGNASSAETAVALSAYSSGQYVHVVGTHDGTNLRIYVNGILKGTTASTRTYTASGIALSIGRNAPQNTEYFNGTIDSTRIYSRVLSAFEILSNYNAANVEFQTRVGSDTSPDDGSWEAWKPTTNETVIDSYDGPYLYNTTDSGLVSYWPMDETADNSCSGGEDACDRKTTYHGTATGTKIVDGKFGKARNLNGTSDYIYSSTGIVLPTADFTYSAWINTKSMVNGDVIFMHSNGAGSNELLIAFNGSDKIVVYTNNSLRLTSTQTLSNNNWQHIAVTRSGSTINLYKDGVLDASSGTDAGALSDGGCGLIIGADADTACVGTLDGYFDGVIDEVRVYSSSLSASTIQQHYLEGSSRPEALHPMINTTYKLEGSASQKIETGRPQVDGSTVGLWHLDETGGTGAYIKNSVSASYNGTPTGTTVVNGFFGKARNFNGSSDYINVGDVDVTGAMTIMAWIKLDTSPANDSGIVIKGSSDVHPIPYDFRVDTSSSDVLHFYQSQSGAFQTDVAGATALQVGKWYHAAVTNDGTTAKIYLNGIQDGSDGTPATVPTQDDETVGIGARGDAGGAFTDGNIDEVAILNRALTAEEIAESFRAGRDHYVSRTISSTDLSGKTTLPFYVAADRPGTYLETIIGESAFANYQPDTNTKILLHLNEQSGSGAYLKDSSGNGNHATPNSTTFTQGKIGKGRNFGLGSTDAIIFPNINVGTDYTIDTWINFPIPNNASNWRTIAANNGGTYHYIMVETNGTSLGVYNSAWYSCGYNVNAISGWHHLTSVVSSSVSYTQFYLDGQPICQSNSKITNQNIGAIGNYSTSGEQGMGTTIDEFRLSNTARTADEIRQAYEVGLRSHPITIDFGAKLDSGNLIADTSDLSFTVDATYYGLNSKGSNLYKGDKIIVKENYDGTEYIAQGTVTAITASTGAVTVAAWDSGSTVPSGGFTVNASVFKWQREYWNIQEPLDSHLNAVTNLTLRLTNGNEGRTIWLDDLRSAGDYLTTSTGSTITSSTDNQYFQYRVIEHTSDEAVSASLGTVTVDYALLTPASPTIGSPTALEGATSIRWAFTDNASNETGFKVYDTGNNLVATCVGENLTYCDETGMGVNTQYTRKVAAYNDYGNSVYSATATAYTLAAAPAAPAAANRTGTTVEINPDPGTNPAATIMAIYRETGTTCDGADGVYLAGNGSSNSSTPVWQTDASWGTVTATGLSAEQIYTFCVKAKNGDGTETAFGPAGSYNVGYVPLSGGYVYTTATANTNTFTTRYVDGSNPSRYVIGLDDGGTPNSAVFEAQSGLLTINSTDTLAVGSLSLTGGSVAVATGGQIVIGQSLWVVDSDADGYSSDLKLYYGTQPAGGRRKNLVTTLADDDCDDTNAQATTGNLVTYYQDTDGDTYGNPNVSQQACTQPAGYVTNSTDCYDANPATTEAEYAYPGSSTCSSTNRGDGSYDYNCSSTQSACSTTYYAPSTQWVTKSNNAQESCNYTYSTVTIIGAAMGCGQSGYTPGPNVNYGATGPEGACGGYCPCMLSSPGIDLYGTQACQ